MRLIYKVRVRKGPDQGLVYELTRKETVIGRGEDCDLPLSDNQTSRRHCKIVLKGRSVELMDMGSTNGTRHNDRMVDKAPLSTGDIIALGGTELLFYSEEADQEREDQAATPAQRLPGRGLLARFLGLGWSSKVVLVLLLLSLVSYLVVAWPLISRQNQVLKEAGLDLARVLVLSLAAANQEALKQGDEMLVNVKQLAGVKGVIRAYIYDLEGRTLAPVSQLHKVPRDPVSRRALAAERVMVQDRGGNIYDLAAPIRVFDLKAGKFKKVGTARIIVSLAALRGLSRGAWLASFISLIFMLACAAAAGILISRLTYQPINRLREELEEALKGDRDTVSPAKGFGPLARLGESLNRALAKLNQVQSRAPAPAAVPGASAGAHREIQALVQVVDQAVLVVDSQNQVMLVSPAFTRLTGLEAEAMQGKHLLEAISDQKLLTATLEIIKQSVESGGQPQAATVELEGDRRLLIKAALAATASGDPAAIALSFREESSWISNSSGTARETSRGFAWSSTALQARTTRCWRDWWQTFPESGRKTYCPCPSATSRTRVISSSPCSFRTSPMQTTS